MRFMVKSDLRIEPTFDRELISLIQRLIRTKTAVYNVIPPAADTEKFIVKLYYEVKETKPEDEFKYIDEKADEWFRKNRTKWLSQIEPIRVRSVIRRLTTAIRVNNFSMITDEDLRLVREYIEILPEIEELRNAIAEALYENILGPRPTTSKVKAESIKWLITHPEFVEIARKIGIKPIIDEAAERIEELIESITAGRMVLPYDKVRSLATEVAAYLKSKNYRKVTKNMLKMLLNNFTKLSDDDRRLLAQAVKVAIENPPPTTAKTLFKDYLSLANTEEFATLVDRLGVSLT